MERISAYQLFALMVFYQIGSTIVFGFASPSGRDAWIAVILSTILGVLTILIYLFLMRMQPGLTLVEWFPAQFGRWLGTPIAWLYPLLFIYEISRILADLKFLTGSLLIPHTPSWVVLVLIMAVVVYGLFSGVEVMGRMGELFLPAILLLFIIEIILLFGSGIVQLEKIQPTLAWGFKPIWNSVWPLGMSQGFAQTLELAMIWPLVKESDRITRVTLYGTILSGFVILVFDLLAIAVLGEDLFRDNLYPLQLLARQINIAGFVENLDALAVLYFSITTFFKLYLHAYFAIRSIQILLRLRSSRSAVWPVAAISWFMGMTLAKNGSEHIYVGKEIFPYVLWIPLLYILPGLLLLVLLLKRINFKKER